MTPFFLYLLEVMTCSGLLFLFYMAVLRNKVFHQWNRFYLLAAVTFSIVLPLLQFTFPVKTESTSSAMDIYLAMQSLQETFQTEITKDTQAGSLSQWLTIAYAVICFIFFVFFIFSLWRVLVLIRSQKATKTAYFSLIEHGAPGAPFSFFHYIVWHPEIDLHSTTGQQILRHEVVHVREKHSWDKLFLQVVQVFFWFNPFFWLLKNELHCIHEFIADKKAVGEESTSSFAAMLLHAAFPGQYNSLLNSFFQTSIKRRMFMLTKKQSPVVNYVSRLAVLPLVAFTVMAFTVEFRTNSIKPTPVGTAAAPQNKALADTVPNKDIERVDVDKSRKKVKVTYKDGTVRELTEKDIMDEKTEGTKKAKVKISDKKGKSANQNPIYLVDGEEYKKDINAIDPGTIESVNVLKGVAATAKYGDKGRNGVVEIKLKKAGQ